MSVRNVWDWIESYFQFPTKHHSHRRGQEMIASSNRTKMGEIFFIENPQMLWFQFYFYVVVLYFVFSLDHWNRSHKIAVGNKNSSRFSTPHTISLSNVHSTNDWREVKMKNIEGEQRRLSTSRVVQLETIILLNSSILLLLVFATLHVQQRHRHHRHIIESNEMFMSIT